MPLTGYHVGVREIRRAPAHDTPPGSLMQALPLRAAFAYRKRSGRREYVRVALRTAGDGVMEAVKYAQDGAGVITSLTETAGLVELPEDTTTVEPGSTVGFLSYAALAD